ncbi:methyl-accepting chemotaxis protein [Pararhodospirillum photometricum]|nr:methyl-accepting chemotaxis protein [Pararhodospirillum photometricum]
MYQKMRLWAKIMVSMGVAITLVTFTLTLTGLQTLDAVILETEHSALESNALDILQTIALEKERGESLARLVAALPDVQERFARGDRDGLQAMLGEAYRTLSASYGVEQFQFHSPPATTFLRLHKPESYGDDLSGFRHTVVAANQTLRPAGGLEQGVSGLGIRAVVPVMFQGRHVGSVEFGLSFGKAFLETFKSQRNVDAGLYLIDQEKITPVAATAEGGSFSPPSVLLAAFGGEPQFYRTSLQAGQKGTQGTEKETPRAVYVFAVPDYAGRPFGVIELAVDRSPFVRTFEAARNTAILIGLGTLGVGLLLSLVTARGLTRRITMLISGVHHVAKGDLSVSIPQRGQDELGDLAQATDQMRGQLHDLALKVRSHARAVNGAVGDITGAVEGQAATSSQMSASVAEITSTMEELSASSTQIAEHSKAVVDIATTTYENAKKGSEAMALVMAKMNDIAGDNQNSLHEILELGTKSKEISKVMEIITAVADQTKLIAFNAALEAASAGDAGRRFGVVAAEIRRLADSVTESTQEIESKINHIQDSISRLVITSEKGATGIVAGREATLVTAGRLEDLVDAARQTTSAAQQISLSTQQQRTASTQVVIALREIVSASSHTAQSLTRVSEVSHDMARLSGELGTLVERFQLRETSGD